MNPFDHFDVPLQGSKLIESSAGTGKTYAIASLYIRLLLERTLQAREILVVTFMEAATEDLRKRIREKLREALLAFDGCRRGDLFVTKLVEQVKDKLKAKRILYSALQSFDEAAIFTIHGFCQKILQESAFETASLFDTKLVSDQRNILREIVEDFWRVHFYDASAGFLSYARAQGLNPARLIQFLGNSPSNPFLRMIPELTRSDLGESPPLENQLNTLYGQLREIWASSQQVIQELLYRHPGLHKRNYSCDMITENTIEIARYLSTGSPLPVSRALRKFCASALVEATNRGFAPPAHPFFLICQDLERTHDELTRAYDLHLLALKSALFVYVKEELKTRKRQQNVRYFDDLLLDLHAILQSGRGGEVAHSIRSRYKAALIDEFQDTDPVQYAIFKTVFDHPEAALFLIGDPKQAIYSFRGADVFSYVKASREVSERYTLAHNWRSAPALITATNAIFSAARLPFVLPEIEFHPAAVAGKPAASGFIWEGASDPSPFKIWFVARKDERTTKPINRTDASNSIATAVASEILRLLNAGQAGIALVDGKTLSPWDIAVLVWTNRQAKLIQKALRELRIPSVLFSDESVFASREALEAGRILAAIADPASESKLKAALVTDALGLSGNDLALLNDDDIAWDNRLKTFAEYRDLWREQGFLPMTRILMIRENVRPRLLSYSDGERRLTNLLQCFELLHQAALKHSLGMQELLKWLAERCEDKTALQGEEYQVRLETDEKAVKVLTIHKSKGLEYAIVFCPFCWSTSKGGSEIVFHDQTDPARIVRDIGSEHKDQHLKLALRESLAEGARLVYVALTRAKYRCYLVWGAFRDAGKCSLAYLLHPALGGRAGDCLDDRVNAFASLTDAQLQPDLRKLVQNSNGSIEILRMPDAIEQVYTPTEAEMGSYACRQFHGEIEQNWGIASFTSLVTGKRQAADLPDRDFIRISSLEEPESTAKPPSSAVTGFTFPRGSRAGLFFHEVFQNVDFTAGMSAARDKLVREKLLEYGFDKIWEAPVCQMIDQVLSTPLQKESDFCLSHVAREQRLHELEFTFPMDLLTPARLKRIFASQEMSVLAPEFTDLMQLGFSPVKGWMKGYIDLVFQWQGRFYLVDWKSNFLGNQAEFYREECLKRVMQREYYLLQSALYCVALHRYLAFRLRDYQYERHFGGAFYLFLRGIDSALGPDFGIYRDRPPVQLITELSRTLTDR